MLHTRIPYIYIAVLMLCFFFVVVVVALLLFGCATFFAVCHEIVKLTTDVSNVATEVNKTASMFRSVHLCLCVSV